jgi:hypothetical protein
LGLISDEDLRLILLRKKKDLEKKRGSGMSVCFKEVDG